jgi:hypothetical protein
VRSPCEAGNTRGRADEREGGTDELGESRDVEEVLDEEDSKLARGYWSKKHVAQLRELLFLGGFYVESFGEAATEDILTALFLRSSELLLARLQLLRKATCRSKLRMVKLSRRTGSRCRRSGRGCHFGIVGICVR